MDPVKLRACALSAAAALAGCLGTSPEQQARLAAQELCGDVTGAPEHCPGTPCMDCHGDYDPQGEQFLLAGTVYANPTDDVGLGGAVVTFNDAVGNSYAGATNTAGNFMIELTNNPAAAAAYDSGRLLVLQAPVYPIASVSVSVANPDPTMPPIMITMASPIHRDPSCATCHIFSASTGSATSPGRIYAIQPPPTGP